MKPLSKPILFVHPRRGLFQLTTCQSCHYKFGCDNCDCNLTTYRTYETNMQLLCHQCQSYYSYPKVCPMCKNTEIGSNFGGVDELIELLIKDFAKTVIKINSKIIVDYGSEYVYVTTRIFDPSLEYNRFGKIIFIQAQNLMASPDYLVNEDVHRSLAELFLQLDKSTEVIFETSNPDLPFFVELAKLNSDTASSQTYSESFDTGFDIEVESNFDTDLDKELKVELDTKSLGQKRELQNSAVQSMIKSGSVEGNENQLKTATDSTQKEKALPNIIDWYTSFVVEESKNRQKFKFPPFDNLVLLTTQEKSKEKSTQKINSTRQYLFGYKNQLKEITIGMPYQAKFLKRKGMFSHHLLIKFPRQYTQYFELRDIIKSVSATYNLQARLNPRHLF